MKISHRAHYALGLLVILFLCGTISSTFFLFQSNRSLAHVKEEIRAVLSVIDPINHSRTMRVRLEEAMAYRDAGRNDDAEKALAAASDALTLTQQAFQTYEADPKQTDEIALAKIYRERYEAYLNQGLLPLMHAAQTGDAARFHTLVINTAPNLEHDFGLSLGHLLEFREAYANRLNAETQAQFKSSLAVVGFFAALLLLTIGVIHAWLRRSLLPSLDLTRQHCATIANGDLTGTIESRSADEIGQMLSALEAMRHSLARSMNHILGVSESVESGSREIAAGNLDLSSRTEEQAASLEQTAASMTELTQTTRCNAENATQARALTEHAADIVDKNHDAVESMIATMSSIRESSLKVTEITGLIEGIAFQTNILALNAAVEAARAGEHGRGFAVVATEVRGLAQRSATAAKEIKALIEASVALSRGGAKQADAVGETMSEVTKAIGGVRDIVGGIASASEDQARGIEQVNQAIGLMDQVTQQNAALVEEAAAAAQSLDQQAVVLRESVARFRLSV